MEERRLLKTTTLLSPLWFISSYAWCISLSLTSVTANTIISDSGFIWAFLLSIVFLHEKVSSTKVLSCALCFASLFLVTISGNNSTETGVDQSIIGYMLVLSASVMNAFYDVMFKKFVAPETPLKSQSIPDLEMHLNSEGSIGDAIEPLDKVVSTQSTLYFLWVTGMSVTLIFWPGLIILNFTGIETFVFPQGETLGFVTLNMVLDALRNFSFLVAVSWTSPLLANVGILLVIPVSIILDDVLHEYVLPWVGWIGMVCLALGFAAMVISDFLIDFRTKYQKSGEHLRLVFWLLLEISAAYFTLPQCKVNKPTSHHLRSLSSHSMLSVKWRSQSIHAETQL
jgi:drug/metabolite transporter (DMT)-like permease